MPAPTLHALALKAKEIYFTMENNRPGNTISRAASTVSFGLAPGYSNKADLFDALIKAENDPAPFGEALSALREIAHADKDSKSLPNIVDMLNHCYKASLNGYVETPADEQSPARAADQAIEALTPTFNKQFENVPQRAEFLLDISHFLKACLQREHSKAQQANKLHIAALKFRDGILSASASKRQEALSQQVQLLNQELDRSYNALALQQKSLEQHNDERNTLLSAIDQLITRHARHQQKYHATIDAMQEEQDKLRSDLTFLQQSHQEISELTTSALIETQANMQEVEHLRGLCAEQSKELQQQAATAETRAQEMTMLQADNNYLVDQLTECQQELKEVKADAEVDEIQLAHTLRQLQAVTLSHIGVNELQHQYHHELNASLAQLAEACTLLSQASDQNFNITCQNLWLQIELLKTQTNLSLVAQERDGWYGVADQLWQKTAPANHSPRLFQRTDRTPSPEPMDTVTYMKKVN